MKSKNTTRQGVRDLNYIKAKPAGIKLVPLPESNNCNHFHSRKYNSAGDIYCDDCNSVIEV